MIRPRQLALGLPHEPALGREDIVVGAANRAAVGLLDAWPAWPARVILLTGPAGSGKSHLVRAFGERSGAVLVAGGDIGRDPVGLAAGGPLGVDDADRADEHALFHLLNAGRSLGVDLLLTASSADFARLADLRSRLRAAVAVEIGEPDDAMLAALLVKLFADRQLAVDAATVAFLVGRMERSFAAALRTVDRIDRRALERRRPVTRAIAAEILRD